MKFIMPTHIHIKMSTLAFGHFQQDKTASDSFKARNIAISFSIYEQLKRHAQLNIIIIIGPVHEISNNVVYATSKASDQPAHTRSLIRAFASRLSIL